MAATANAPVRRPVTYSSKHRTSHNAPPPGLSSSKAAYIPITRTAPRAKNPNANIFDVPLSDEEPRRAVQSAKFVQPIANDKPYTTPDKCASLKRKRPTPTHRAAPESSNQRNKHAPINAPRTRDPQPAVYNDASRAATTAKGTARTTRTATPTRNTPSPQRPHAEKTLTPKQSELWDQLLGPTTADQTRRTAQIKESQVAANTKRPRLIDRLASTLHEKDDEEDDGGLEESMSDVDEDEEPEILQASSSQRAQPSRPQRIQHASHDTTMSRESSMSHALDLQTRQQMLARPRAALSREQSTFRSTQSHSHSQAHSQPTEQASFGSTRTYAQTRAYLQDDDFATDLLAPISAVSPKRYDPYAINANGAGDDDLQPHAIRSLHELRAAAAKTRLIDDMHALMQDFKSRAKKHKTRRRVVVKELFANFKSTSYVNAFISQGLHEQFCQQLQALAKDGDVDLIADLLLLVCMIRFVRADIPRHVALAVERTKILDWMLAQTDRDDLLCVIDRSQQNLNKKYIMTGAAQRDFGGIMDDFVRDELGCDPDYCQIGNFALQCANALAQALRRAGLHQALVTNPKTLKGLAQRPGTLALSILEPESMYISGGLDVDVSSWPLEVVNIVAHTLPYILRDSDDENVSQALRICINISNLRRLNCNVFAARLALCDLFLLVSNAFAKLSGKSKKESEYKCLSLDVLLLSLGLLINLVEYGDDVRKCIVEDPDEFLFLERLVDVFVRGQERAETADSLDQSRINVAYGYLAVLLGNLCVDESARQKIRDELPHGDLSGLKKAIEDFIRYHRQVDEMMEVAEGRQTDGNGNASQKSSDASWKIFTQRLQVVLSYVV